MAIKPIIFNAESVRALLAGQKTQTRRVIKPQPPHVYGLFYARGSGWHFPSSAPLQAHVDLKPRYAVGDILWVREALYMDLQSCLPRYAADDMLASRLLWAGKRTTRPPMFMPKDLARLWLHVIDVRGERLQDISHKDALAEGCQGYGWAESSPHFAGPHTDDGLLPQEEYEDWWNRIYGKDAWGINPWVFVYEFEAGEKPEGGE